MENHKICHEILLYLTSHPEIGSSRTGELQSGPCEASRAIASQPVCSEECCCLLGFSLRLKPTPGTVCEFPLHSSQAYGRDLMEAQEWCRKYMKSGNVKDLTQAWDLYYHVFRRISKQLPQVGSSGSSRINCHFSPSVLLPANVLTLIPKHLLSLVLADLGQVIAISNSLKNT